MLDFAPEWTASCLAAPPALGIGQRLRSRRASLCPMPSVQPFLRERVDRDTLHGRLAAVNPAAKRVHRVATLLGEPLRAQGFRRKGLVFWRGDDEHVEVFELQPRTIGNQGSFCVNLGVGFRALGRVKGLGTLWAAGRGIFATPWPRDWPRALPTRTLTERLGMLLTGRDSWWSVTGRVDVQALADEVLRGWERAGVKWMKARATVKKARRLAKKRPLLLAVLSLAEGERSQAERLLLEALSEAPTPMSAREIRSLALKNGLTLP